MQLEKLHGLLAPVEREIARKDNLSINPHTRRIADLEKQIATLWLVVVDQTKRIGALEVKNEVIE